MQQFCWVFFASVREMALFFGVSRRRYPHLIFLLLFTHRGRGRMKERGKKIRRRRLPISRSACQAAIFGGKERGGEGRPCFVLRSAAATKSILLLLTEKRLLMVYVRTRVAATNIREPFSLPPGRKKNLTRHQAFPPLKNSIRRFSMECMTAKKCRKKSLSYLGQ